MKIRLRFIGAGLWDGEDVYPYDDTPFPRVPNVGEHIVMPDSTVQWRVVDVIYDFLSGFNYEPVVGVVCARPSDIPGTVYDR